MKKFAIIFILFFVGFSISSQGNDLRFNSDVWKGSDKRLRGRMSSDLQNSELLINKSKSEVENLLGEPNDKDTRLWRYDVNLGGFSTIQFNQLNVFFDESDNRAALSYIAN